MDLEAIVFDMDGTLLHTFPDLARAANEALGCMGFPQRTYDELLTFMGEGGRRLIECAVPPSVTDDLRNRTFELWRDIYLASHYAFTEPFPGILPVLHALRERGVAMAVLSNKFDEGVRVLASRFFPGLFDVVLGDAPPAPRKPDPTSLLQMLVSLHVSPSRAAYVGDTLVDVQLARNAGVAAIGVAWGYARSVPLPHAELDAFLQVPADLLHLLPAARPSNT